MKTEFIASFAAALVCHLLLLFGFQLGTPARPLELSEDAEPVDVSLVPAAPEAPAVQPPPEPMPEAPPPPEPESTPLPSEEPMATTATETPPEKPKPQPRPAAPKRNLAPAAPRNSIIAPATASGPAKTALPRYRSNPKPEYPPDARRQRQEGVVLLSVQVSADGRAESISLKRSSGVLSLDQAAIEAVRRWTFESARAGGLPVSSRVDVPVRFALSN